MRTTDEIGRWGCVSVDEENLDKATRQSARRLFADLTRELERKIDGLRNAVTSEMDEQQIKDLWATVDAARKVLNSVLMIDTKLMRGADAPRGGEGKIDLAAARSEIESRLDRLAGRGGAPAVPG